MEFELINIENPCTIVKQHFLIENIHDSNYWIYDAGRKNPYEFICPGCQVKSILIDHLNCKPVHLKQHFNDPDKVIRMGGTGLVFKIIRCSNCGTCYYIGLGLIEPNNGRDVYVLHTILEIVI